MLLVIIDYFCVLIAILADLVSGLRKAKSRGEKCTSSGLRRSVDKIGRYYHLALFSMSIIDVLILTSLHCLKESGIDLMPCFPYMTTFGAISLTLIEVKSICERSDEKGDLRMTVTRLLELLTRLNLR